MLRAILGVIVGYIAMAVVVIAAFSVAFIVIGNDRAFQPGTYDVTPLWLAIMFVVSLIAAVLGGVACSLIAKRGSKAPAGLAVLVVVLGAWSAYSSTTRPDPGPRAADVPVFEAAQQAKQPLWVAAAIPVVGVVGVMVGAALTGRCKPAPEPGHSSDAG